jgi:predicted RND superfamily exporter protein
MLVASLGAAAALLETKPLGVRIDLDPSSTPLLPSGDPGTAAYRRAVLDFGDDEIFVIAMETDNVFTYENLSALRRLGRAIAKLPGVRSTESLVNVSIIRNDPERDLLEVRPLIQEIPHEAAALAALRERALADPLLSKSVVSTDGRSAALNVRFHDWTDLELIRADVDGQLRALLAAEISTERRFYVAGRPHMKAAAHALMVRDLRRLMPLAVLVMALLLWIVIGSARGVIIPIGTVLVATLWTFGVMALWNVSLNLLTVVLGPVLIAVGSVYGVHILAHYESAALRAESSRAAADLMAAATRAPVLMAGASTVIGFGALLLPAALVRARIR